MKIRIIIFAMVLASLASCKNFKQTVEHPVVANIKLDKTMLAVSVVADSLHVPWDIQFLDDHQIIYTEIEIPANTTLEDDCNFTRKGFSGFISNPNFEEGSFSLRV